MAEYSTAIASAEDFSHAVLCVLEGAPENWDSDARAEERRIATSRQLEAWFDAHGLVPANAKDREIAHNELQDVIELASLAYHQRGRTAAERAREAQEREGFVELMSSTIEEMLYGTHAKVSLEDIETLSANITQEAKARGLNDEQTTMMRIMAFAGTTVQRGMDTLNEWHGRLEEHAPRVHGVLQDSERFLRNPLPPLSQQFDRAYQHVKEHQPRIVDFITHSPTLKFLTLAVMMHQGIGGFQKGSTADRASAGIELAHDEKVALWTIEASNRAQSSLQNIDLQLKASTDAEGVKRVGFGISMDSKHAKSMFHRAGVDYDAVYAGKASLTQEQALRILVLETEIQTDSHLGFKLHYNERIAAFNQAFGQAAMDDIKPWYREPEKFAFHAPKTSETGKPEAEKTPQHTGKFAQKYSYKSERLAPSKAQQAALQESGTKVITANVQLSPNPNAYMSRPLLEETIARLKDVPHDRDFGNPKDPGSQKFYDAQMVALKGAEGFSDVMYYCRAEKPTIGYGCRLDLKENTRLIEELFPGKYSIKELMARTQRLNMDDARTLAHTMMAIKERELMEWIGPAEYAAIPESHKGAINDMNYNGGHGAGGLVGSTLRHKYRTGDLDGAIHDINENSNGNNMKSLGDRRTFNVGMALLDANVIAGPKQTARTVEQAVKLHISSLQPKGIKELVVNLGVPKIDPLLESRLNKSRAIKEALRRGADVMIAADNDTLVARADASGKVEFKEYTHTDRLLAEASGPSKDGLER